MATIQQVLATQDAVRAAELLLSLLSEYAAGRERGEAASEVCQGILRNKWPPAVRALAYEVAKAAPVADSDAQVIIAAVKADITSGNTELAVTALSVLQHLQAHVLAGMLDVGDIATVFTPALAASSSAIRAAGLAALGAVLLVPDVTRAAASSVGLANQAQEQWQAVGDGLLDDSPAVVAAALGAVTALLQAGLSSSEAQPEGFLLKRLSSIMAARISAALGPVLEMCSHVGGPARVDVARMLLLVVAQAVAEGRWLPSRGDAIPGLPPSCLLPGLSTLATSAVAHLMGLVRGSDPAPRMEAARSVVLIASLVNNPAAAEAAASASVSAATGALGPAGTTAAAFLTPHAAIIPGASICEAIAALISLEESGTLMEGGAEDAASAAVEGARLLPPAGRAAVLRRLWPCIARTKDSKARVHLFAAAWAAAMEVESGPAGISAPALTPLPALLQDRFFTRVFSGRLPAHAPPPPPAPLAASLTGPASSIVSVAAAAVQRLAPVKEEESPAPSGTIEVKKAPGTVAAVSTNDLLAELAPAAPKDGVQVTLAASSVRTTASTDEKTGTATTTSTVQAAAATTVEAGQKLARGLKGAGGKSGKFFSTLLKRGESGGGAAAAAAASNVAAASAATAMVVAGGGSAGGAAAQDHGPADLVQLADGAHSGAATPKTPVSQLQLAAAGLPGAGASGGGAGAGAAGFRAEAEPQGPGSGAPPPLPQYAALRHELVTALLAVVAQQPAASHAQSLCNEVALAAAHDRPPPSAMPPQGPSAESAGDGTAGSAGSHGPAAAAVVGSPQQAAVLAWLKTARMVLQATSACMFWEPHVTPAITAHISAAANNRPPADFSCAPSDAWLQLAQAAAGTARALRKVLRPAKQDADEQAAVNATLAAMTGGDDSSMNGSMNGNGIGGGSWLNGAANGDGAGPGGFSQAVTEALKAVEGEHIDLQALLKQLLRQWAGLSRANRPRVLWVAGRCMDLAPHSDEGWELCTKALHDLLCRAHAAGSASRIADLITSAANGVLFQSGRIGWPKDIPFQFDVVAASALCERPDYEASGIAVGLCIAQHFATILQDALGASTPATAELIQKDCVFVAARLDAVLREFLGQPQAADAPPLREWAKRTLRALASTVTFEHPAAAAEAEAKAAAQAAAADAAATAAAVEAVAHGRIVVAAGSSSDEEDDDRNGRYGGRLESQESDSGGANGLLPVTLPMAMYLPPGVPRPPAPPPPSAMTPITPERPILQPANSDGVPLSPPSRELFAQGTNSAIVPGSAGPAGVDPQKITEDFKARIASGPPGPPYLVKSGTSDWPWGYPFAPGPRAVALFNSRRSRRNRNLLGHVATAVAHLKRGTPLVPGLNVTLSSPLLQGTSLSSSLSTSPLLPSTATPLRLDSPAFWSQLSAGGTALQPTALSSTGTAAVLGSSAAGGEPGAHAWVELTGPADPLLLLGALVPTLDQGVLLLRVQVVNRSDTEVTGASLSFSTSGPAILGKQAISWALPRLSPRDRTAHAFQLKLQGFGPVQVEPRLHLLPVGRAGGGALGGLPTQLACSPLPLSLVAHMMRPPRHGVPTAKEFYRTWSVLPARLEVSGTAVWPGEDGAAVALSAILRTTLAPVSLQYLPMLASYQAAFAGETWSGEEVLVQVVTQLQPPLPVAGGIDTEAGERQQKLEQEGMFGSSGISGGAGVYRPPAASVQHTGYVPIISSYNSGQAPSDSGQGAGGEGQQDAGETAGGLGHGEGVTLPTSLVYISVRSSSHEVAHAISHDPVAWLRSLAGTTVDPLTGNKSQAGARVHPHPGSKPPLHSRIEALHAEFAASARALPAAQAALLLGSSDGIAGVDVHVAGLQAGAKVSRKWMEAVAQAEWQRLVGTSAPA